MRFYWPIAKVDGEQRMVWGYASTEALDDQGETVSRDALAAALDDYMRFANIREMHQNSAIGVAREAGIDERGLYIGAKIVDDDAWRKVVEGVYKGFSIGGRVTGRDLADRRTITGLLLTEISVVDRPANPEAVFDCWKLSAGAAAAQDRARGSTAGSGDFADPGYQADRLRRYPLDTERHIRAAWAFIHQPTNARRYTPDQIDRIKARIAAAWRAEIDPAGPPAASVPGRATDTARKNLDEADRLAQIIVELDWLADCIALEAAAEGDASPLPQRMQQIIAELRDFLAVLVGEESGEPLDGGNDTPGVALAAAARGGMLRKAPRPDILPVFRGLAKLAEAIVPRLDALSKRVEEIARTPLPPQTVARGFAGIAKREDGGGTMTSTDDVVAALAQMNDEERTLTLIKAAHANPRTPF